MYLIGLIAILILLVLHSRRTTVYRFCRDTCGYCRSTQAEWDKFKSRCMLSSVCCIDVDTTSMSPHDVQLCQNFAIEGKTPTIWVVKPNGCRWLYTGDRSCDDYSRFIAALP